MINRAVLSGDLQGVLCCVAKGVKLQMAREPQLCMPLAQKNVNCERNIEHLIVSPCLQAVSWDARATSERFVQPLPDFWWHSDVGHF